MLKEELQNSLGFKVSEELYEKLNSAYEAGVWKKNEDFRLDLLADPLIKPFIEELGKLTSDIRTLLKDDDVIAKTIIEVANNLYSEEHIYNLLDYCVDKLMNFKEKIWYKLEKGFRLSPVEIEYLKNHTNK